MECRVGFCGFDLRLCALFCVGSWRSLEVLGRGFVVCRAADLANSGGGSATVERERLAERIRTFIKKSTPNIENQAQIMKKQSKTCKKPGLGCLGSPWAPLGNLGGTRPRQECHKGAPHTTICQYFLDFDIFLHFSFSLSIFCFFLGISYASSGIVCYHAWACFWFSMMLIFWPVGLVNTLRGQAFTWDAEKSPADHAGVQLTQVCGVWVL